MFFSCNTSHWLEPVCIVCSTLFNSPILHSISNNLCYFTEVKGISPEMGSSTTYDGDVFYNYPPIRRFSFGVRLIF